MSQEIPDSISRALLLSLSTFEYKSCLYCLIHFTFWKGTNFCLFWSLRRSVYFHWFMDIFFYLCFLLSMEHQHALKKKKAGYGVTSSPMGICPTGYSPDGHLWPDWDRADVRRQTCLEKFRPLYWTHTMGQTTGKFHLICLLFYCTFIRVYIGGQKKSLPWSLWRHRDASTNKRDSNNFYRHGIDPPIIVVFLILSSPQ